MQFDLTILITIAALVGTISNLYKKQWCFIIWLFTNTAWAIYDYNIGAKWQALQFAIYAGISVVGIIKWRDKK